MNPGDGGTSGSGRDPVAAADRQREIVLRVVRVAAFVLVLAVTLLAIIGIAQNPGQGPDIEIAQRWWLPVLAATGLFISALVIDIVTPEKKLSTVIAIVVGLIAGMLATIAVGWVIDLLAASWDFARAETIVQTSKVVVGIVLAYLAVVTVLQTKDDFRLVVPYVEFAKQMRGTRPIVLDTSVLIDARILDIGETGFVQSPVVIPSFVLEELHTLADSGDKLKRSRGRRGLDIVGKLQRSALDVTIDETQVPGRGVDQMLIELAKQQNAVIMTTDSGLDRVAGISGIQVLNLNDLANSMKPAVIPGEQLSIDLIRKGEQKSQAVGYLPDGTMVVAENGIDHVGERVSLTVTSSIQTSAGRMIFGKIENGAVEPPTEETLEAEEQAEEARVAEESAEPEPQAEPEAESEASESVGSGGPHPPKPASSRRPPRGRNPRR